MDKNVKNFIFFSVVLLAVFAVTLAFLGFVYNFSTINTYNFVLLIVITLIIIISLLFILSATAVIYTYRSGSINKFLKPFVKVLFKFILPVLTIMASVLNSKKDILRQFFIDINNILVESENRKYPPDKVLILLPHCLQYSGCSYKIAGHIENCKRCGRCCIGEVADIAEEAGALVEVVTGGTAARAVIEKQRPGLVISVACERDLAAGISDVKKIPVLGILNDRPNGQCKDTQLDTTILERKLKTVMEQNVYR